MASPPTTDAREAQARKLVCNDVALLAPKFGIKLRELVADANAHGYDLHVYETARCDELQQLYYALHRSKAPTIWKSWHGYRLAADLISREHGWDVWPNWNAELARFEGGDPDWWEPVVAMIRAYGLHWGGDWVHSKDTPHVQWWVEGMFETPSDHAKALFDAGGYDAVWNAVGAA